MNLEIKLTNRCPTVIVWDIDMHNQSSYLFPW